MAAEGDEDWLLYGGGDVKKEDEPPVPGTEDGKTADDGKTIEDGKTTEDGKTSEDGKTASQLSVDAPPFEPKEGNTPVNGAEEVEIITETVKVKEEGGEEEPGEIEDEEEEDDDSDDDVQVTIGAIKTSASYETPKFKSGYQRPGTQQGPKQPAAKGVDVDAVGEVSGVPLFEFDLDNVEDKPWRKPGADITDYFNYGFTEDTWSKYCEKQRRFRMENNATSNVYVVKSEHSGGRVGQRAQYHRKDISSSATTPDFHRQYKPKYESPIHSQPTTINVIGSTSRDTRRPGHANQDFADVKDQSRYGPSQTPPPPGVPDSFPQMPSVSQGPPPSSIPVMGSMPSVSAGQIISVAGVPPVVTITSQLPPVGMPYSGLPPTSIPPPSMVQGPPPQVIHGPPPGAMIGPPPGMVRPPPGFGPPPGVNVPPPGFPGGPPPQNFGPPPGGPSGPPPRGPPGSFPGDRPPFNSFPPASSGPPPSRFQGPPPPWDRERGRKERDWMDLPLSDDDFSGGSDDERRRRKRYERDRESRDRRKRSRSRERERRYREERHRSRRK